MLTFRSVKNYLAFKILSKRVGRQALLLLEVFISSTLKQTLSQIRYLDKVAVEKCSDVTSHSSREVLLLHILEDWCVVNNFHTNTDAHNELIDARNTDT